MKDSSLLTREYRTIGYVSGPLIFVTGVEGCIIRRDREDHAP